ncbi:MAG: arginine--tRNA ligase [Proteobacteria bacterium]|nr:arginine--tRNA ligase [Pseudomonadota bacterium]MDA1059334.1 arginine--tRNA ligase [Pseudomonadota bacterium]
MLAALKEQIAEIVVRLGGEGTIPPGLDTINVVVELPRNPDHGDLSTNVAMVLAKPAQMSPRDLAALIAPKIEALGAVASLDVAGPGFINLRLVPAAWHAELHDILAAGPAYGTSQVGGGEKINVEYVSANPTGPMHVGHCRGAVVGDSLANLLAKAGYAVTREYYINDAGAQVATLARSLHLRYREVLGETVTMPDGWYPGDYLIPAAQSIATSDADKWLNVDESVWFEPFRATAVDAMMVMIREDLAALGIRHDVFFSEKTLHSAGKIDSALADLEGRGLVYKGVLAPPKGKEPEDWEPREQTLFRATDFGDDTDRPLQKSDGAWTYFAADIAYHRDKIARGFTHMVDVWGADHGGYIKRMKAAVAALSGGTAELDVRITNLVKLMRAGEPMKMSKRSGNFVTLREVVDEVGRDVTRFMMLTQKPESPLDFDFQKVTEQSKDNPVFYVQYAHARIRSVMRRAGDEVPAVSTAPESLRAADLEKLSHNAELALIRQMALWPGVVENAARAHEPHRVAYFLYDLASAFHTLWNQGTEAPELRFLIEENPELTRARLALLQGVAAVIASGLGILGVEPVEEMR